MPGKQSAQGTTVYFDGVLIGWLTGFDEGSQVGQLVETTNVTSPVVGTGANARVVKSYDCTSIEPPTFAFTFFGPPSYGPNDVGKKATLTFNGAGRYWTGTAILREFNHAGRPNQYTTGGASFQATT